MPRLRSQFMNDNSKHAYPVDAQRSTYRWARLGRWSRQAGAVLGVFYVIGILIIWPEPVRAAVPPQEAMLSFLPKNVLVQNAAIEPDITLRSDDGIRFLYRESFVHLASVRPNVVERRNNSSGISRRDHVFLQHLVSWNIGGFFRRLCSIDQPGAYLSNDCRRFAVVFEAVSNVGYIGINNAFFVWPLLSVAFGGADEHSQMLTVDDDEHLGSLGFSEKIDAALQLPTLAATYDHQSQREQSNGTGEKSVRVAPNFLPPTLFWLLAGGIGIGGLFYGQSRGWDLWDRGRRLSGLAYLIGSIAFGSGVFSCLFCWPLIEGWLL